MTFRSWTASSLVILFLLGSCTEPPKPLPQPAKDASGVVSQYRAWVLTQADSLLVQTEAFVKAVKAADRAGAQKLYAAARMPYERIEPIAEALGDLDPRIDAREGDVPDADWGGFHKLEKALWSTDSLANSAKVAQTLLDDVRLLRASIETTDIKASAMVVGAVELLNEVSTSKVTGEEERYSHTDLWDFQANVEGSAKIWELVAPLVKPQDATLSQTIDDRSKTLLDLLATHKSTDGYKLYGALSAAEVKSLAAAVDALAEPLSGLGRFFPAE